MISIGHSPEHKAFPVPYKEFRRSYGELVQQFERKTSTIGDCGGGTVKQPMADANNLDTNFSRIRIGAKERKFIEWKRVVPFKEFATSFGNAHDSIEFETIEHARHTERHGLNNHA